MKKVLRVQILILLSLGVARCAHCDICNSKNGKRQNCKSVKKSKTIDNNTNFAKKIQIMSTFRNIQRNPFFIKNFKLSFR